MWLEIGLLFVSPPRQLCPNTQMAVDDNLIGFSSLTLHTTSIIIRNTSMIVEAMDVDGADPHERVDGLLLLDGGGDSGEGWGEGPLLSAPGDLVLDGLQEGG